MSTNRATPRRLFVATTAVLTIAAAAITWTLEQHRVDTERSALSVSQRQATRLDAVFASSDTRIRLVERGQTGRLSAIYSVSERAAWFSFGGLDQLPAGKTYQVWRVANGSPTSLEVVPRGETSGSLLVEQLSAADLVVISVEQAGGAKEPSAIFGRLQMS